MDGTMELVFKLWYQPMLAPGPKGEAFAEGRGTLHVFQTRDLLSEREYGVQVLDVSERVTKTLSITIEAGRVLSDTSGIGVNAYCRTWAPQGYECRTTAGSGFLYLQDIVKTVSAHASSSNGRINFNVALCERTSTVLVQGRRQPVIKGRVIFALQLDKSKLPKEIQIHASPFPCLRARPLEKVWRKLMLNFCQASVQEVNDHFLPSEPRELMEPIRCPFYENDVLLLWGSAYCALQARQAYDLALFDHLLRVSLQRHKLTASALEKRIGSDRSFFQEKGYELFSSVVAHLLSAVTWALPYMPDAVNANTSYPFKRALLDNVYNEHYKNTLTVLEGDCDGLAWLTHLLCIESQLQELGKKQASILPLTLRVLQLLAHYYLPLPIQGAATVGNSTDTKTGDHDVPGLCCHTFCVLLPLYMVRQCLERVPQKIPGVERIQPVHRDGRESVLEVILLEGTGPCAPLQLQADDSSPQLRPYVKQVEELEERYPVLQNVQRLMYRHHRRTTATSSGSTDCFSLFYRSAVTAYTVLPFKRYGIPSMDLLFVRCVKSSHTYGITAKELFTRAPTTGLYFFNVLDQELQDGLTPLDVMRSVFERLEPVPLLLPPSAQETAAVTAHVNQLLESVLYSRLPSQAMLRSSHKQHTVLYYCRLDNLNAELIQTLKQLHKQGIMISHRVVPLATTELQRLSPCQEDGCFPITAVDIELTLSTDKLYI